MRRPHVFGVECALVRAIEWPSWRPPKVRRELRCRVLVQMVGLAGRLKMSGNVREPADDEDDEAHAGEHWQAQETCA